MSKAFTREESDGPDVPDLPPLVSALPAGAKNYMTRRGADRMREERARLLEIERPALAAAGDDESKRRLSLLDQRVFQLEQSLQSAEVISPPQTPAETVTFGASVTVQDNGGEESVYRIVGVDETDFDRGWISWLSPLARALMNAKRGQTIHFHSPSGPQELKITGIKYE